MEDFKYQTKVISGFPGTGKTYFVSSAYYVGSESCADSDSSKFDKAQFPQNYIDHIKSLIGEKYAVFVSSHKIVREALVDNGIAFTLVYPDRSLKDEYIQRYIKRGSPEAFVKLISDNWDEWLKDCEKQQDCEHIVLQSGQTVSNFF